MNLGSKTRWRPLAALMATFALLSVTSAAAQQAPPVVVEAPTLTSRPGGIVLQTRRPMPAGEPETWFTIDGFPVVRNVSTPTLTVFLPLPDKANGTAVVIAPGGGFMLLAMEHEGYAVAEWLRANGVAAFVLKYRVRPTEPGVDGFSRDIARMGGPPAPGAGGAAVPPANELAADDAQEAMRVVRANAAKWNVDPTRIGFMGFSAGAMTAMNLVYRGDPETMPAFVAPIYGNLSAPGRALPESVPPMWAALAANDPLFGGSDLSLLRHWRNKGGAYELHLFERGEHGFGFPGRAGTTSLHWGQEFLWWLEARGLLQKAD